jgi:hypothetical protein
VERPWLSLLLLFCLAASAETPSSPEQLIRAAVAARAAQQDWKFTYREDDEFFQTDKEGRRVPSKYGAPRTTYDVIMIEGEPYRKLFLIDGEPLDAGTEERVEQALEKARVEHPHEPARIPTLTWHYNARVIGIEQLEEFFETKVIGEETALGRRAWRLESVPRRDRRLDYKAGEMVATRVVIWLDQQDGAEIKQTTSYASRGRGPQIGTEITEEYSKVGEAWLLDNARSRGDAKFGLTQRVYSETDVRRYDYKRFTVDSRMVTP